MQRGARIGAPMCLPASDFLTPSQGRTVALGPGDRQRVPCQNSFY